MLNIGTSIPSLLIIESKYSPKKVPTSFHMASNQQAANMFMFAAFAVARPARDSNRVAAKLEGSKPRTATSGGRWSEGDYEQSEIIYPRE